MEMCREEHLGVSASLMLCCYEFEGWFWLVLGMCVGKGGRPRGSFERAPRWVRKVPKGGWYPSALGCYEGGDMCRVCVHVALVEIRNKVCRTSIQAVVDFRREASKPIL